MTAIVTKFHGATNRLGARVKAFCNRGSLTVSYNYDISSEANHRRACAALLSRFAEIDAQRYPETSASDHHWGEFVSGFTKDSMVHVLIGRMSEIIEKRGSR